MQKPKKVVFPFALWAAFCHVAGAGDGLGDEVDLHRACAGTAERDPDDLTKPVSFGGCPLGVDIRSDPDVPERVEEFDFAMS